MGSPQEFPYRDTPTAQATPASPKGILKSSQYSPPASLSELTAFESNVQTQLFLSECPAYPNLAVIGYRHKPCNEYWYLEQSDFKTPVDGEPTSTSAEEKNEALESGGSSGSRPKAKSRKSITWDAEVLDNAKSPAPEKTKKYHPKALQIVPLPIKWNDLKPSMQQFLSHDAWPEHGDPSGEEFPLRTYFVGDVIKRQEFEFSKERLELRASWESDGDGDGDE